MKPRPLDMALLEKAQAEYDLGPVPVTREAVTEQLLKQPWVGETEAIVIIGSLAYGNFGPRSDIDVVIVVQEKPPERDEAFWYHRVNAALGRFHRDTTVLVYTLQGLKYVPSWYTIVLASDHIMVYDKGKVAPLFEKIIAAAKRADLVRKVYDGRPVWQLGRPARWGEIIRVEVTDDD
ncbi:MAG: nucleotidyltransferase domain-containing protein [Planctomycetes bacterium]|nr:nucleotidyltransferase domain-containing protein [Planctomycetota bacterium]MBM4081760.1 nucleotidyltransferase domain-containing protein [Planctomycetota bacterium]MBM4084588.1 nucleotidyltransferase domain-containing protein [Planctomycetota bacterium]